MRTSSAGNALFMANMPVTARTPLPNRSSCFIAPLLGIVFLSRDGLLSRRRANAPDFYKGLSAKDFLHRPAARTAHWTTQDDKMSGARGIIGAKCGDDLQIWQVAGDATRARREFVLQNPFETRLLRGCQFVIC
jgi:hypothetical protein